jgi:hypothetical protein
MNVMVTIPLAIHNELVARCEPKSPEFKLLKNGLIEPDDGDTKYVRILCNLEMAEKILRFAEGVYPKAASDIIISRDSHM